MIHLASCLTTLLAAWDPLEWVHEMDWYQAMLQAEWFRPIRPYWIRYNLDWVVVILLLLGIALVVRSLVRRARLRSIFRTKEQDPLRAAKEFLKMGKSLLAAEAYLLAGEREKALKIYVQEDLPFKAAQIAEQTGQVDLAVDLYLQVKDQMSAIRVLRQAGELERAAEIHRVLGNLADAGQMYLDAGELRKAAALFQEARLYSKAAQILASAGEDLQSAECLLKLLDGLSSGFTREEAELFSKGAQTLKKAERLHDSARLLQAAGEYEAAARSFLDAGEEENAAACFEKAGRLDRAAELYRASENKEELVRVLELMRRRGHEVDGREMARAYQQAGQHDRAAESYKELGDVDSAVQVSIEGEQPAEAAMLLVEQGRHAEAADLFMQAEDPAAAREQFLLAGDHKNAAKAAVRAGSYFEAGKDFLMIGDAARAVDALQQVPDDHPNYRTACSLLAQSFSSLGDQKMAENMHRRATEGQKMYRNNLELFYQQARYLEETDDASAREQAKRIYADILGVHYTFRDVKTRHERLLEETAEKSHEIPRLGKYYLLEKIGRGGVAEVFKAFCLSSGGVGRFVAVKLVRPEYTEDHAIKKTLLDEAEIASLLNHSNIARILDYGEGGGRFFIVLEYINGTSLRTVWRGQVEGRYEIPIPMAVYIVNQICEGLEYAHRKTDAEGRELNIIHRDISPENVVVSYTGEVKIIDFGIAKATSLASQTRTGVLKGKFAYMSPEQVRGLPYDQRVDVFSCGVILFELLAGRRLFAARDDAATLENVRNAAVPPLSRINPEIKPELGQVLLKALAKDRDERYMHAGEMGQELKKVLAQSETGYSQEDLASFMRQVFSANMKEDADREAEYQRMVTMEHKGTLMTIQGGKKHEPK